MDIVERLRHKSKHSNPNGLEIYEEAADEIERLRAELAAAKAPANAAWTDVLAERRRQIEVEGWTPEHDDEHDACELARAAACYAVGSDGLNFMGVLVWPWGRFHQDQNYRRAIVKAAALLLAEIERLDRAAEVRK